MPFLEVALLAKKYSNNFSIIAFTPTIFFFYRSYQGNQRAEVYPLNFCKEMGVQGSEQSKVW